MSHDDFKRDLKTGKEVEKEVCEIIKTKYPNTYLAEDGYVEGKYVEQGYDIVVPDKPAMAEVKYDSLSCKTGKYFVETESNGNPSCLSTTKSNWWVVVDDEHILWIYTESLKYVIMELKLEELEFYKILPPKRGYLVPKDKLMLSPYSAWEERKLCRICPF